MADLELTFSFPDATTLELYLGGINVYMVNWGDGNNTYNTLSHTYGSGGTYNVSVSVISGNLTHTSTNGVSNQQIYLISCGSFGGLINLNNMFVYASNLISVPSSLPINVQNMSYMFFGATSFNQDISTWDVSSVISMNNMLDDTGLSIANFNAILNGWASLPSLQNGVTLGANGLSYDSAGVPGFTTLTTSPNNWIIQGASLYSPSITRSPLQLVFTFSDEDINRYSPSERWLSLNISGSAINNGTFTVNWGDGTTDSLYYHPYTLSGLYTVSVSVTAGEITNFNGTSCQECLISCTSFGNIGLTDLMSAFSNATILTQVPTSLPPNVNNMSSMFQGASIFNQDINSWDTSNVTNMSNMFIGALVFNGDISLWNTQNVLYMDGMFSNARKFNGNISNWNVSNVRTMNEMFINAVLFNGDISNWNVSNVESMESMFNNAREFNANISSWNTSKVVSMSYMFNNARQFNANIGGWNVSSVLFMTSMFNNARQFNANIDLWNTQNVAFMNNMFYNSFIFNQNLGSWNVSNVTDMEGMFNFSGMSTANFNATLIGWASLPSLQYDVSLGAQNVYYDDTAVYAYNILTINYNWEITSTYTCFKEGTKILTKNGYIPIEDLKIGDLVLTYLHEYIPIALIGTSKISHFNTDKRIIDKLYMYSKESHPELIEDLVITGWHSILVDDFKNEQEKDKTSKILGNPIPIVDNKYKLPSFVDEKSEIYDQPGLYNIYHFALESEDENRFFGIYANGLLVESCSKHDLLNGPKLNLIK